MRRSDHPRARSALVSEERARRRLERAGKGGPTRRIRLFALGISQWPALARRVLREAAADRVAMVAGSLAFHAFLALVPILIGLLGLLGLVGISGSALDTLVHDTSVLLPSQMAQVIDAQLRSKSARQAGLTELVAGMAVALWSSIEAMAAFQIALDVAYEVPKDRSFVRRRVLALPLIGVTIVLGGVASALLVLGNPLARLLPTSVGIVRPEYHVLLLAVRYGGALLLVMMLLSAYYRIGPSREHARWEWVSPGSVAAAIGWLLSSAGFSFYLDHFGHESRNYGALAGVAVTLIWMFLTAVVVLLGAELNRELERVADLKDNTSAPSGGPVAAPT